MKMDTGACLERAAGAVAEENFVPQPGAPQAFDGSGAQVHPSNAAAAHWNTAGFVAKESHFAGKQVRREALALLALAEQQRTAAETAVEAALLLNVAARMADGFDRGETDPPPAA